MLLDERRAGDGAAGAERLALVDRAGHRPVGEMDVAPARRLRRTARGEAWKAELGTFADRRQPDIDHLDRLVGRMVRVAMLVKRVECGADAGTICRFELRHAHR